MRYIVKFDSRKYGEHEVGYSLDLDKSFGNGKAFYWARYSAVRYGGALFYDNGSGLAPIDLSKKN